MQIEFIHQLFARWFINELLSTPYQKRTMMIWIPNGKFLEELFSNTTSLRNLNSKLVHSTITNEKQKTINKKITNNLKQFHANLKNEGSLTKLEMLTLTSCSQIAWTLGILAQSKVWNSPTWTFPTKF
jgi:hypothetical protein